MNEFYAIILGLVQGISEWLPISSKTQVLFASTFLFSLPLAVAYAFGLFMEIGSIGSAIAYFRNDIWSLLRDRRLLIYLLVVTAFTGIVGVPLYYLTDKILSSNPYNIGIPDSPRACANWNGILHQVLAHKAEAVNWPWRDETQELRNYWDRAGNRRIARCKQVRNDRLNNAVDGRQTRASFQIVLSRLHSRLYRSPLRDRERGRRRDFGHILSPEVCEDQQDLRDRFRPRFCCLDRRSHCNT